MGARACNDDVSPVFFLWLRRSAMMRGFRRKKIVSSDGYGPNFLCFRFLVSFVSVFEVDVEIQAEGGWGIFGSNLDFWHEFNWQNC